MRKQFNPSTKDPILKLVQLSEEIWGEKKGLGFSSPNGRKKYINKIEKLINEINDLHPKLIQEIEMLREMNTKIEK